MSLKLALALRGHFAISQDGVDEYFPLVQALYRNPQPFTAEELPQDVMIDPDDFDDDDDDDGDFDDDDANLKSDEFTGRIVVMAIRGPIMHYGGPCSYGADDYAARLRAYADDDSISAGLLDMDSPGGQVEGTETWASAVQYFASKKPIISFCEDGKVASAAVWGTAFCTERYAGNTLCRFGSVGVMACLMDMRKAMEMEGINEVVIYAPQSTDKNKTTQDAIDGKTAAYKADLKFICDRFIEVVNTQLEGQLTSDEWQTGKMFFAEDAARIGLINGIKSRDQVIARLQELAIQKNQTNMFGNKLNKISALKDKEAITAEELEAANEQLAENGIKGVTLALDSELETASASVEKLTGLESQITAKDGEIAGLKTQVENLQAKLKTKPATAATSVTAEKDKIDGTADEPEYEMTSVDLELAQMKKNW